MLRKFLITLAAFVIVGVAVFAAGAAADSSVGLPQTIAADSPCPAVGCASGTCHGFDTVPEPDGIHGMDCPRATCSSVDCHAWDALANRYHQPSDMSLNVWILLPVALVVGLVLLVRKL